MRTSRCATIEEIKSFNAKERERFNTKEEKKNLDAKEKERKFQG